MNRVDATPFTGKRALITGGLGFIGSHLAQRLVDAGAEVAIVDCAVVDSGANAFNIEGIRDRVQLHATDVRNAAAMRTLVAGQDFLFNFAAQVSHIGSMHHPHEDLEVNATAQVGILEACRAINSTIRIVHASTRQVYGHPDRLPVDEQHPTRPVDANGISQLAGESYYTLYHRAYGLHACVLRFTNTFGPHMRVKDARQMFLGIWIRSLLEGQPIDLWGGDQRRDLSYVDDAVDACCAAAVADTMNGEVLNVGGSETISLRALAELLISLNGSGRYAIREFPEEHQRIAIGDYTSDDRKLRRALQWAPRTSLRDGLARTLAFYREHLAHYV